MRSSLEHLPPHKQRELERIVQIVFEEFEDVLALATQDWKRKGRISKIVLYGSYARGGWVDEPHTAKGYQSDYDLLIIVNDDRLTDRVEYWSKLDDRLIRELSVTKTVRTPVNFIVHSTGEVNSGLSQGRYFFMDVARDGIAIYQAVDDELPEPQPKTPHAALEMAKEYFEEWYPTATDFYDSAAEAMQKRQDEYAKLLKSPDLFAAKELIPLKPAPYEFGYRYRDDDGMHECLCHDWEIEQTYTNWSRKYGEADALDKLQKQFGERFPGEGMMFAMGTHSRYPDVWMIIGIIKLAPPEQGVLI